MGTEIVFKKESYRIMGACFEVYKEICFDTVIVEIKALKNLADEHRAQLINYLKATGKQLGLLINFSHYPKIEYERFVNQSVSRLLRVS